MELRALFDYLWAGRIIVLITTLIGLALGILSFISATRIYEASAILSAAPGSATASRSNNALSGAARLIGLGGGGGADSDYNKFQALLTSSFLAERLAARPGFLQRMYPERWDAESKTWRQSSGPRAMLRAMLGRAPRKPPQAEDVRAYILGNLDQNLSIQTALLTLRVTAENPEFARDLLVAVHRESDNILRDAARQRSQLRIRYLQKTLPSVEAIEQRQVLIQLLNQEEQTNMMIESDPNYAADIVDPSNVPPDPVSPVLTISLVASLMIGAFLGVLLYLFLRAMGWRVLYR